ncbi:MAG: hypothetical protein HOP10_09790 [Chitinophagaceae bacterium]|nr:hypothetical protein [Chitinophagaceae bacterium]
MIVNKSNFENLGWVKDQVNITSGITTVIHATENVAIKCPPFNPASPLSKRGAVQLSLPTSADSTLRRVRLRNTKFHGVRLAEIARLHYNTFIVSNINQSAPNLAFQVDINGDDVAEFNILYDPTIQHEYNSTIPGVLQSVWQNWNARHGWWQYFQVTPQYPAPPGLPAFFQLPTLLAMPGFNNLRIINTTNDLNAGGGIRFTVGGHADFNDFRGYIDQFMIQLSGRPHYYDFACDQNPLIQVHGSDPENQPVTDS